VRYDRMDVHAHDLTAVAAQDGNEAAAGDVVDIYELRASESYVGFK
jgi:hypothetical protein